ncbi:MAG: Rpn family recombination-promoting nuclease/putative transposase [Pseudomonadota bacterium]
MNFKPGRLLDPKADLVFKKIFGCNKDLVKSFLNNVLPLSDDELIDTLDYLTSEQVPRTPLKKYSIVDVRCKDKTGRIFIVEMQMGWSASFKSRLQFGTAKAYVEQLDKGEQYELLNPVYGLALVGEIFDYKSDEWYHHYKMVNVANTGQQIKGLELVFVELPKFKATSHMEKKLGILWLRFLNEINTMNEIPHEFTDVPEICKAIELTQEASYTKEELAQYDGYWDQISCEKSIKSDAKAEGRAEGKAEVALKMLTKKLDDETIMECSGLTADELAELKASLSAS